MVAYEFYSHDDNGDVHLIGILPERRKSKSRISHESIVNWVKRLTGNGNGDGQGLDMNRIYFIQVEV